VAASPTAGVSIRLLSETPSTFRIRSISLCLLFRIARRFNIWIRSCDQGIPDHVLVD
jgi:hypothetical protein